jgi:hypothetical protein
MKYYYNAGNETYPVESTPDPYDKEFDQYRYIPTDYELNPNTQILLQIIKNLQDRIVRLEGHLDE